MSGLLAHVGMDAASMLIWFGMFAIGILFIGWALRDEGRTEKQADELDGSVRQIRDVSNLPLNHVREALRPRPTPTARPRSTPEHRTRPRHPDGPRLVR